MTEYLTYLIQLFIFFFSSSGIRFNNFAIPRTWQHKVGGCYRTGKGTMLSDIEAAKKYDEIVQGQSDGPATAPLNFPGGIVPPKDIEPKVYDCDGVYLRVGTRVSAPWDEAQGDALDAEYPIGATTAVVDTWILSPAVVRKVLLCVCFCS